MIKKLIGSLKKTTYFLDDQEAGAGRYVELKEVVMSGVMQIEKDGQLIDIQLKNIYKSDYETPINHVQLHHSVNMERI